LTTRGIAEEPNRPLALDPEGARHVGRPPYAVVDIGSNSVRLVVYDRLGRAPFPRFNEKSLCRLGAGLDQTSELSAESCRRTVEAMRRFRAIADAMGVPRIDVIATEAIRRASNGDRLVAAIAQEAGFAVRVLTGAEEAHYAALGVIAGFYRPSGLVGDMGGGSLEVAEVADDRVGTHSVSLPLGALPVQALLAKTPQDRRLRVAACAVSDISWCDHASVQASESFRPGCRTAKWWQTVSAWWPPPLECGARRLWRLHNSSDLPIETVLLRRVSSGRTHKWRNQSPMTGRRSVIACSKSGPKSLHLPDLAHGAKIAAGCPTTEAAASAPTWLVSATFVIIRMACLPRWRRRWALVAA
jgi:Ppx/GppA phosphatase family